MVCRRKDRLSPRPDCGGSPLTQIERPSFNPGVLVKYTPSVFESKLAMIRQKHGYTVIGAANDTGITEEQWKAMEDGKPPDEVLDDELIPFFKALAGITGEHPSALLEEAGLLREASQLRGQFRNAILLKRWHKGRVSLTPKWFQAFCHCGWHTGVIEDDLSRVQRMLSEHTEGHRATTDE